LYNLNKTIFTWETLTKIDYFTNLFVFAEMIIPTPLWLLKTWTLIVWQFIS